MADLLSVVKEAANAAVEAGNPVSIVYGEVLKNNPVEVKVDQRFSLPADFLVVPESLRRLEITIPGLSGTVLVRRGLEKGDQVIMIRAQGGQQFIILDRVVAT